MRKPDTIVGRNREWRLLERFLMPDDDDSLRIGIVSGRRRAGKTHLLQAVSQQVGGLFHTCVRDEDERAARVRFAATIARFAGTPPPSEPDSWEDLFRTALNVVNRRTAAVRVPLLVFDEAPYAIAHSPELPGLLQLLYDEAVTGNAPSGRLILCGSSLSVMRDLLSGTKALRGRAMMDLRLGPLDFRDSADLWGIGDPQVALHVHACVGGYPGYRRLIPAAPQDQSEFDQWVADYLLNIGFAAFSHTEVDYLLSEEPRIRDKSIYYGILLAVATGSTSLSKIGAATGHTKDAVRFPVQVLRGSGYLEETNDVLRKRQSVTVSDPIIRFDRIVTAPQLDRLELDDPARIWQRSLPAFRSMILGPHFEQLCREWLSRFAPIELGVPEGFGTVGTANVHDHTGRAKHEIDAIALRSNAVTFLGEAKATLNQRGVADLERLERCARVLASMKYHTDETRFGIFSRSGFTPQLQRLANGRPDVELIDTGRLYGR